VTAQQKGPGASPSQSQRNIAAICEMERRALERRSGAERFSDFVAHHAGRFWFVVLHSIWFAGWILWNTGMLPGVRKFDPFPFSALTTVVSLEAIFLSLFILTSQNRGSRRADERAHLDLQVNLLAEDEATKMLQMLKALCAHHKLPEAKDAELEQMLRATKPEALAQELEEHLSDEAKGK
jgi:uncharacterized membrane protein